MTDDEPLTADDEVTLRGFLRDLTYREIHLAIEGLFDGFRRVDPQFQTEVQGVAVGDSWYYKAMYIVGYLVKVLVLVTLVRYGLGV